jgi:N-acetylglucosaminyl-diphospho-decaprenol L-rhamnosyltransferase
MATSSSSCRLSIIIVSYNVQKLLVDAVSSIYRTGFPGVEVIVVDNNSADGSVQAIQSQFPQVRIVENKVNRGFSGANNQGIALAKGEFIFLLNPDTELFPDSIALLLAFLEKTTDAGIVAPRLLNTDGTFQPSCYKFPSLWSELMDVLFLGYLFDLHSPFREADSHTVRATDSASGAALLFHSGLVKQLGYVLDEDLFWSEDLDFCYRVHRKGLKVYYYPEARVVHHLSRSARQNYRIPVINQMLSRVKFFEKHGSKASWFLMLPLYGLQIASRILLFLLLSPFRKVAARKLDAYLYSTRVFWRYFFKGERKPFTG